MTPARIQERRASAVARWKSLGRHAWRYRQEFLLAAVFCAAFAVRAWNLAYNSAFSDEAIYVVIGKLGLFQHDWYSYNAQSWMAGLPYVYPPLTAIAYGTKAMWGSRFLNVVFGMLTLVELYKLTRALSPIRNESFLQWSALIAVYVAGFSAIAIFVSKLATYDGLSFWLLLFGINHLLIAHREDDGKKYFLGALALVVAFCTKIIVGAFIPPIIAITLWKAWGDRERLFLWRRYFLYPLCLGIGFYFAVNLHGFLVYAQAQSVREYGTFRRLFEVIWYDAWLVLIAGGVALGIIFSFFPSRKNILLLLFFAAELLLIHFAVHRYSTLEKHTVLTILFLSPIIGYAAAYVLTLPSRFMRFSGAMVMLALLAAYPFVEYGKVIELEHQWLDSDSVVAAMHERAKPGEKILTETGPDVILGVYDTIRPTEVTTFDWFEYEGQTGDVAYLQAVRDGYFDMIELNGTTLNKLALVEQLHRELEDKYRLSYRNTPFEIYERRY